MSDHGRIRKIIARGAVAVLVTGLTLTATAPGAQAAQKPTSVTSGNARFEVLSPR